MTSHLWSQCDRHFVGQLVVLCVVKWWRFVVLLESNWIGWFTKMSVLSLSYWVSDVYWRQNNKHFTDDDRPYPHKMAENSWCEEITSLSPYVYYDCTVHIIVGILEPGMVGSDGLDTLNVEVMLIGSKVVMLWMEMKHQDHVNQVGHMILTIWHMPSWGSLSFH